MGVTAADSTVVCLYRTELQTDTIKYTPVSIVHLLVGLIHTGLILVKGVQILHDKLAAAHETEAGTDFVTILILNLI